MVAEVSGISFRVKQNKKTSNLIFLFNNSGRLLKQTCMVNSVRGQLKKNQQRDNYVT